MEMNGFMGVFHRFSLWVVRLAYLNIVWILFTLAGLVIVGVGASTLALFAVLRKMIVFDEDVKIFHAFKEEFKLNFSRGIKLSFLYTGIGLLIYFDIRYFSQFEGMFYEILVGFFTILFILFGLAFCYVFPICSHFQMKTSESFKNSFLFPVFAPLQTLLIVLGLILCTIFFTIVPGFLPFLGISLPAYVISYFAQLSFKRLEEKRNQANGGYT
ncbi:hypothetical protein A8F94_14125 [Bacillus sp. FJAT-27225]|uniref:YesL family protein n=1 Tax=Bacillus sp. FJAT-27225 TaxID=1743144 RepID=UPI00080C2C89|nr:DUF624 domain-containing protein [Bacillus sp. FJAT-27225]OCA85979.1 hypothetical protein A8F94_14125 [Bacillus sp. FJAT-27225]